MFWVCWDLRNGPVPSAFQQVASSLVLPDNNTHFYTQSTALAEKCRPSKCHLFRRSRSNDTEVFELNSWLWQHQLTNNLHWRPTYSLVLKLLTAASHFLAPDKVCSVILGLWDYSEHFKDFSTGKNEQTSRFKATEQSHHQTVQDLVMYLLKHCAFSRKLSQRLLTFFSC